MEKNTKTIELTIDDVAFGGDGLGHLDGKVVFVPGTLPGERITATIKEEKKKFSRAELLEVKESSPHRVKPLCPFAFKATKDQDSETPVCPGCVYQHVEYNYEVELKNKQLSWFLCHDVGMPEDALTAPIASASDYGYRNKIVVRAQGEQGDWVLGYCLADNKTIFNVPKCPLARDEINELMDSLRGQGRFWHTLREKMKVTFRHTKRDEAQFWRNRPKANEPWLIENTVLGNFSVPRGSFFQINSFCQNALIEELMKLIKEIHPKQVIDLYSGVGVFSVAAAKAGAEFVLGMDFDGRAIKTAEYNAEQHELTNCEFRAVDLNKPIRNPLQKGAATETTIIVDPPRSGLGNSVLKFIPNTGVKNLIYISCAADTLARDLRILAKSGYKPQSSRLIDMFPQTSHFESITLVSKE